MFARLGGRSALRSALKRDIKRGAVFRSPKRFNAALCIDVNMIEEVNHHALEHIGINHEAFRPFRQGDILIDINIPPNDFRANNIKLKWAVVSRKRKGLAEIEGELSLRFQRAKIRGFNPAHVKKGALRIMRMHNMSDLYGFCLIRP